jgi:uncharacterized membrane protein
MQTFTSDIEIRNDKTAYAIAVAIALVIASVLLVTYFVAIPPKPDTYTTIYLLDSSGNGTNYPEYLVSNLNSTFSVYVNVENHLGRKLNDFQVLIKVTNDLTTFPVDSPVAQTFNGSINDGGTWATRATVTLNDPGYYSVVFELWIPNKDSGELQFSGNSCVLNIQVSGENIH